MIEEIIRMAESLFGSDDITVKVLRSNGRCYAEVATKLSTHGSFGDTVEEAIGRLHAQVKGDYQAEVQRLSARLKELNRG